jgi:putative transposase
MRSWGMSKTTWDCASAEAEPNHDLEGIHSVAYGGAGRHRFFTVEVLTWRGLVTTYYVLFFIHLETRRVSLAGMTRHHDQGWMQRMVRNATGEGWGFLDQRRNALHDRDAKFCSVFRATLTAGGIKPMQLPARSPNLNAYAERWVRSVREECFSKLILFAEVSLRRALTEFIDHFHGERNHPGKGNSLLFPCHEVGQHRPKSRVHCRARFGGLLQY